MQIQIADILVANKIDLADADAIQAFNNLAVSFSPAKELITTTKNGLLKTEWLDLPHVSRFKQQAYYIQPQSQHWQTHSFVSQKNLYLILLHLNSGLAITRLLD